MRLRNRQRLRLPGRLREEEEEGYFEDDGQGNEAEENDFPEIPDEIDGYRRIVDFWIIEKMGQVRAIIPSDDECVLFFQSPESGRRGKTHSSS